jgi:hypothetical protein
MAKPRGKGRADVDAGNRSQAIYNMEGASFSVALKSQTISDVLVESAPGRQH